MNGSLSQIYQEILKPLPSPPGYKSMCQPCDDNGDGDDGNDGNSDDDDDESYSEDKEANTELQTKVITAIDN